MAKIDKLSEEQAKMLEEHRRKWKAIALSTEPADRAKAEAVFRFFYEEMKEKEPKIEWFDSPLQASKKYPDMSVSDLLWGQHESYWISYYLFFEKIGVQYDERDSYILHKWKELSQSCGWWAPYEGLVLACERPSVQRVDEANRLHCLEGPAIEFRDGWKIYAIQSVVVKPHVIEEPEKITLDEILSESHVEVRRILREQYGQERFLKDTGAELVDVDYEGARQGSAPRALLRDREGEKWLVCCDGSTEKVWYIPVSREAETCSQAHESVCLFDEAKIKTKS